MLQGMPFVNVSLDPAFCAAAALRAHEAGILGYQKKGGSENCKLYNNDTGTVCAIGAALREMGVHIDPRESLDPTGQDNFGGYANVALPDDLRRHGRIVQTDDEEWKKIVKMQKMHDEVADWNSHSWGRSDGKSREQLQDEFLAYCRSLAYPGN